MLLALAAGALAGAAGLGAAPRLAEGARCPGPDGGTGVVAAGAGRSCAQADPRTWQMHPARRPADTSFTLEGTWQGRVNEEGRLVDLQVTFQPDGTFIRHAAAGDGPTIRVSGTYTVSRESTTAGHLTFLPVSWQPAQICTGTLCLPLDVLPSVTRYTMPDGDTLQIETGVLYRSR